MEIGRYRPARARADHLPVTARQGNRPRVTTARENQAVSDDRTQIESISEMGYSSACHRRRRSRLRTRHLGPAQVPRIRTSVRRSAGISAWLDGAALSATGLSTIVFALIESQRRGETDLLVTASTVVGVVGLLAFVAWERREPHPMPPLSLFANRNLDGANVTTEFV